MKKNSFLLWSAIVASLVSCDNNMGFKKTKSGLMYKIVVAGKDSLPKVGEILKINYTQKINDSLLRSSYNRMPAYAPVPPVSEMNNSNYDPTEIFNMLRKGDSVVVVQLVDTLLKKMPPGAMPPFMKKGDKLVLTLKVEDVFKTDSIAQLDQVKYSAKEEAARAEDMKKMQAMREKEMNEDLLTQTKTLEEWLAKKGIKAQKTGKGTYVEIKDAGTGTPITNGVTATVKYIGKKISNDSTFDSNSEPGRPPFSLQVGTGQVIKGWDEGLLLFKKGGKGTLYIPGALAYGRNPGPGSPFGPNEALKFDIEIVDVALPGAPTAVDSGAIVDPHAGHGHK
jgi:FKBP-type peptidyl-prolyl cis-trans isomerase